MPLPTISPELIKALESLVPPEPPKLTDSDRQIWFNAGRRSLVEYLAAEFKAQQENPNGSTVSSILEKL